MVDMGEQVEARGRGTGVLFPSSLITDSVTQQGKFAYNHVDVKYTRMLKCGQTAGIKLNKVSLSKDKQWGLLSLHSKQQMLKCDCIENLVQDIQHLVHECVARGHLMDKVLLKTRELFFKFGEEYKVDIWDKLPKGKRRTNYTTLYSRNQIKYLQCFYSILVDVRVLTTVAAATPETKKVKLYNKMLDDYQNNRN